MEGTCSGRYGFIVCITHIENVSEGIITDDGTARAKFAVEYDCVAYRPFKNEVLDAVVTQVNKFGFFAEAGPLQLFVSNSLVPDDVKYATDENCYKSDDGQITIGALSLYLSFRRTTTTDGRHVFGTVRIYRLHHAHRERFGRDHHRRRHGSSKVRGGIRLRRVPAI